MAYANCHSFFLFLSFTLMVCAVLAEVEDFNNTHWQIKLNEAMKVAQEAYEPNPELITQHVNKKVAEIFTGAEGSRRILKREKTGICQAYNPIDRCWRCRPDWMENRKRLADCAIGFGHKVSGGKNGNFYVVFDPSDDDVVNPKPGTLRHAVTRLEPLWIIFDRPMTIKLNQELIMTSNKTIDARGANVHIAGGAGITLQFIQNVIIHGLHIHDIVTATGGIIVDAGHHLGLRTQSDGDGISIFGSANIWIDHVSMSNCTDGLIDIIMGSTGITISNGHFTKHNDVMLFGANEAHTQDSIMQVTVAFNHFGKGLIQRMPRVRYGFVHVVNNDYTHWLMYAIGGNCHPTIISQGNRFIAPDDPNVKQVTKREAPEYVWRNWQWRSEGDMFINGAYFLESGQPRTENQFIGQELINAKTANYVGELTRDAGPLGCRQGQPC